MRRHVQQHTGIHLSSAESEIVNPQHPRDRHRLLRQRTHQPQQRHPRHHDRHPSSQPGTGPTSQRHRNRLQHPEQTSRAAPSATGQAVELLGERPTRTANAWAEESAHRKNNRDRATTDRTIGHPALIAAVDPGRHSLAVRARRIGLPRPHQDLHLAVVTVNLLNHHPHQMRKHHLDQLCRLHSRA